jgi:hypothetical protein
MTPVSCVVRYGLRGLFATLTLLAVSAVAPIAADAQTVSPFLQKPYLQLGDNPSLQKSERLQTLWQTIDEDSDWQVDIQAAGSSEWKRMATPISRRVAISGIEPHRVWKATLDGLKPGAPFTYRILKAGNPVFQATGVARKAANQPVRFVVFGDCGQDTPGQKAIAYQTMLTKPDFVFITGDIVYGSGRISEYRTKYFPIYNADESSPTIGAPLTRSIPFLSSPGNHDILNANFEKSPDTMAYFYYWSQPLNGPIGATGAPSTNTLTGPEENRKAFLAASGENYPRMANFSFDYGNAHWTILDANSYVDWTDSALRAWVEKDLEKAKKATWRFVAFHQPGFNSSYSHFAEQRMRLMSDIFEKGKVDIVFNGHVHNYQRSYPMRFKIYPSAYDESQKARRADGPIAGEWTLDKTFDGDRNAKPDGVLYIVTGAGGAGLYDPDQQRKPNTWQTFTYRFISEVHSLTAVDIDGKKLTLRQINSVGAEVDRFTIRK